MALCPCCSCMKQISHRSFPPSDHIVQITNLGSAFQELRSSSFILAFDKCKWYSDTPVLSARSSNVLLVQLSAKNAKDPSKRVQNEFLHEVVDTWWNWSLASGNPHFNHFIPKFRHTDRQGISNTGQWNASEINAFLMLSIAYKTSPERSSSTITIPVNFMCLTFDIDKAWQNHPRHLSNMFKQDETIVCIRYTHTNWHWIDTSGMAKSYHASATSAEPAGKLCCKPLVSSAVGLLPPTSGLIAVITSSKSVASCAQSLADTKACTPEKLRSFKPDLG